MTFWEVDILRVGILRVDILGVDLFGVDILGIIRFPRWLGLLVLIGMTSRAVFKVRMCTF